MEDDAQAMHKQSEGHGTDSLRAVRQRQPRDIKLLEAGRYLPAADNGNENDALATLYGAVRRAENRMDAALTREQLWVFEVEELEMADMMDRAQEMCAAGLGAFVRVTEVRLGWGRNRIVAYLRKPCGKKPF